MVNAEHVRKLNDNPNTVYENLPAVQQLMYHGDLDAMVILKGNDIVFEHYGNNIVFEHYGNNMGPQSLHSC